MPTFTVHTGVRLEWFPRVLRVKWNASEELDEVSEELTFAAFTAQLAGGRKCEHVSFTARHIIPQDTSAADAFRPVLAFHVPQLHDDIMPVQARRTPSMQETLSKALKETIADWPNSQDIRAGGWRCPCKAVVYCWSDQLNSVTPFLRHVARCAKAREALSAESKAKVDAMVLARRSAKGKPKPKPKPSDPALRHEPPAAAAAAGSPSAGETGTVAPPLGHHGEPTLSAASKRVLQFASTMVEPAGKRSKVDGESK